MGPRYPPPAASLRLSESRPLFRVAGSVSSPSPARGSAGSRSRVVPLDRSDPGEPNYGSPPGSPPSPTAAVVIDSPARTSATARIRNSAGKGRGMGEASQREPDRYIISGSQTMGHVKIFAVFRVTKPWGRSESQLNRQQSPMPSSSARPGRRPGSTGSSCPTNRPGRRSRRSGPPYSWDRWRTRGYGGW